jgi:outer membrane protein OmpA-like peptidoglycan-associated protein
VAPFLYYRVVQAGHRELLVDEVRLEEGRTVCYQAQRKLFGGILFDSGQDTLTPGAKSAYEGEIAAVVQAFSEWSKKGTKPTLVLHGYAEHDEAPDAEAASALSRKRAEMIRDWLVAKGIGAQHLSVEVHGWNLSPAPLSAGDVVKPHRAVEISSDSTPPSRATRTETDAADSQVRTAMLDAVRSLQTETLPPPLGLHAPNVSVEANDGKSPMSLRFDLGAAPPAAMKLHRMIMQGLAEGCRFKSSP